jgi:hypothetical protein
MNEREIAAYKALRAEQAALREEETKHYKNFIFEVLGESREIIVTTDTWENAVMFAKKYLDHDGQRLNLEAPKRIEEKQ